MSTKESSSSSLQIPAFTFHPSLTDYLVPYKVHLSTQPKDTSKLRPFYIATGALTFDSRSCILLIQRASTDSMPNLWEIPGGACDEEDQTILHGLARELHEEAGLFPASIGPLVGEGHVFLTRSGKLVCKYNFMVEIDDADESDKSCEGGTSRDENGWVKVRLDPNEHQKHVWATEEEVRGAKVGDIELKFTKAEQKQVILDAFQLRKEGESSVVKSEGKTVTG